MKKPRGPIRRQMAKFEYFVCCDGDGDIHIMMTQAAGPGRAVMVRFCIDADDAYTFANDILRKYDAAVGIA